MGPLSWVVVGLVAGWLAQRATGLRGFGCLGTILVGIVGGLVGGILFRAAGDDGITEFGLEAMLVAFVGASVVLLVVSAARRRR